MIGPGVAIEDGAVIHAFSHLERARVGGGASVGPFARLRPGADVGVKAKVGNFVELKNAKIEQGAKVNHLSYIGDARVGASANIGAGTITCNYDGIEIQDRDRRGAFIGSNSSLVAPVTIGEGAYVASGSVITKDVEPGALAVARGRQETRAGWARRSGRGTRSRDARPAAGRAPEWFTDVLPRGSCHFRRLDSRLPPLATAAGRGVGAASRGGAACRP